TPGVALNDDILTATSNNFLAAIHFGKQQIGISFLDVSTGEYLTAEGDKEYIDKLIQNFNPSEVLISKQRRQIAKEYFGESLHVFYLEDWVFKPDYARQSLLEQFSVKSLKGFGVQDLEEGIIAAGAALHYLSETQHDRLSHITRISRIAEDDYVWMDRFTIRNLEIYQGTSQTSISLLDVIDKTKSPMGARMLKRWLALPLKHKDAIERRHQVVSYFMEHDEVLDKVQDHVKRIFDLERLISKVATGKINPREVVQLKKSIEELLPIKALAVASDCEPLRVLGEQIQDCSLLIDRITEAIQEEAPVNILRGNVIAPGYSDELDELRNMRINGKSFLDAMLDRETMATGISSLKIGSNNVFGYYIEVRNTHKDKVPETWIRKQTLVNSERYITEELKEYETKILTAEEKIEVLEQQLFSELLEWLLQFIDPVQHNASLISKIDCFAGFAELAMKSSYVKPSLNDGFAIDIKDGRHPVIEKQLPPDQPYIANDVY